MPSVFRVGSSGGARLRAAPHRLMRTTTPGEAQVVRDRLVSRDLFDGRGATLEDRALGALGALDAHSQTAHTVGAGNLKLIAAYENTKFTSARAQSVAAQFAAGVPADQITNPEDSDASVGNALYVRACKGCHAGVNPPEGPVCRPRRSARRTRQTCSRSSPPSDSRRAGGAVTRPPLSTPRARCELASAVRQ